MVNVLIYKLESVRKPSGKVINELVDKEVTLEEAKKILKSRIECKSEIMYDRIENKKLIKGKPTDYNWVDYKSSFDKKILNRLKVNQAKKKLSRLNRAPYLFKCLKYDIGNLVFLNHYTPDELSELIALILKKQISESSPLGNTEWFHTDTERLYRNQTRQNMCNFLLCSGANVNKVSTDNETLLFKALQTLIEKDSKQLAVKATVERLLDSSRIICDDIKKYIGAETLIDVSNITPTNIELTRKNINDSTFRVDFKAKLHERLDTFLEKKNEYHRTHTNPSSVKSESSNETLVDERIIPYIHVESSPQTNSPETKRMLRRWSNYHTEHLWKHPRFNPSKQVSYAKIVRGTVAGNKQSKKKKQKQSSTPKKKATQRKRKRKQKQKQKQSSTPKKKATQRKRK